MCSVLGRLCYSLLPFFLFACGAAHEKSKLKQETDDRTTIESQQLIDVSDKINVYVQTHYEAAKAEVSQSGSSWSEEDKIRLIEAFGKSIGATRKGTGIGLHLGGLNIEVSTLCAIEDDLIQSLSPGNFEIKFTSFADSRYGENSLGLLNEARVISHISKATADHSISPAIRIGQTLIGLDKFGHFINLGRWYFLAEYSGQLQGYSERLEFGKFMEGDPSLDSKLYKKYRTIYSNYCKACMILGGFGYYGMTSTGVSSPADMQANEDGFRLYQDIFQNPETFVFDIRNYVSELWNEEINPNTYKSRLKVKQ